LIAAKTLAGAVGHAPRSASRWCQRAAFFLGGKPGTHTRTSQGS